MYQSQKSRQSRSWTQLPGFAELKAFQQFGHLRNRVWSRRSRIQWSNAVGSACLDPAFACALMTKRAAFQSLLAKLRAALRRSQASFMSLPGDEPVAIK